MKQTRKIPALALIAVLFFSCTKERLINQPGNLVAKTVDQDPSLPSVTINGAKLHAEAFGHPDSTIVIVLHGGPGGDYRSLLNSKDLVNYGYRVVFYDQRGSGLSQRFPRKFYTSLGREAVDLMYEDLGAVIAHYRTHINQKVFLLGHSWGAILATGFTGRHPDAVQGLVVAEPGGLKWNDIDDYIDRSRSFEVLGELMNDAAYQDQFITGKENQHEILDYKLDMLASKNDITGDDNTVKGSTWRSGAVIMDALFEVARTHHPDFSDGIRNFNTPVLFFHSGINKAYPSSWARQISGAFHSADIIKVPGVGHSGIISDKKAWTQITLPAILNYFNSL